MNKKVFMIFNDAFDKRLQAVWFVNNFIKKSFRDLTYLLACDNKMIQKEYGISCSIHNDGWVWVDKNNIVSYTDGMTQVYYKQKDLGEL